MYNGVCIGGPLHGEMRSSQHNWFNAVMDEPLPKLTDWKKLLDGTASVRELEHFRYLHSEEYTEWGNLVICFIWDRMGALPRLQREKFIATALTGVGKAAKPTEANREILWPGVPKFYWR